MSKKQILKSALLGSLVIGTLAFGSFKANAAGFNQKVAHDGITISPIKFDDVIHKISSNQIPSKLAGLNSFNANGM